MAGVAEKTIIYVIPSGTGTSLSIIYSRNYLHEVYANLHAGKSHKFHNFEVVTHYTKYSFTFKIASMHESRTIADTRPTDVRVGGPHGVSVCLYNTAVLSVLCKSG